MATATKSKRTKPKKRKYTPHPSLSNTRRPTNMPVPQRLKLKDPVSMHTGQAAVTTQKTSANDSVTSKSWETMYVRSVDANVQGVSLLDIGHAHINSLKLTISDTSAVILSGKSLRRF